MLVSGSHGIMRTKGSVEGTDICLEKTGATLNLETQGLGLQGVEITVNNIDFVERGRDICMSWVASSR